MKTEPTSHQAWAEETFGKAKLGDKRRTRRLVAMAARMAEHPAGRITQVFSSSSDQEGAFDFVENDAIASQQILLSASQVTALRCLEQPRVLVAGDQTSLNLLASQGTGPIGARSQGARGLEVFTLLALTEGGTPLGLLAQCSWARPEKRNPTHHHRRPFEEKEPHFWLDCVDQASEQVSALAPKARLWFQFDAQGDFRELLAWAVFAEQQVTVRAGQDRAVGGGKSRLWKRMERQPCLGHIELQVAAKPSGRKARVAHLALRAACLRVKLTDRRTGEVTVAELWAVQAKEVRTTPPQEEPLEWLLWTNQPVQTLEEAQEVVEAYSQRWRVEDFHKTWKSVCRVEENELQDGAHVQRWASIQACVAVRLERLKRLSREEPELPAREEFSQDELQAIELLHHPAQRKPEREPTLGEVVRWIAERGGYTGRSSGGPPGTLTLARGLKELEIAVATLRAQREQDRLRRGLQRKPKDETNG